MDTGNNYFFIDGSAILGDICEYNKDKATKKILDIEKFINYCMLNFRELHGGVSKRFSFYFVEGEDRLKEYIKLPETGKSNSLDMEVKFCGKKLPKSKRVDERIQKNNPPNYVIERFNKSEKGVDITICSDILFLAGLGKIDRAFLYTNDSDFIPMCKSIKNLGCNISLIKLSESRVNLELLKNMDSFSTIRKESLDYIFVDK